MRERSHVDVASRTEPDPNPLQPQLSDEQWELIADLFANQRPGPQGGRPKADPRACLEGILWVLRSGARWKDMPSRFPSYVTCWRRFVEWSDRGVLDAAWRRLVRKLDRQGQVDWKEGFADGTFASAKGGQSVGKTRRGKGTKIMVLADAGGLPLAIDIEAANQAEVNLIEPLIDSAVTPCVPNKLIYDRAADSDPLRNRLAQRDIELVCPHRKGRVRPATQDGRKLRRFRRRWIIERTISWLHDFRRLIVRHEFYARLFHGFLKLACLMMVFRRF